MQHHPPRRLTTKGAIYGASIALFLIWIMNSAIDYSPSDGDPHTRLGAAIVFELFGFLVLTGLGAFIGSFTTEDEPAATTSKKHSAAVSSSEKQE